MKKILTATLAGCGSLLLLSTASAAPLVGGATVVDVTVDLGSVGIVPAPLGDASVIDADDLIVQFPITGGDLDMDTLGGMIEHVGSGLSLTANDVTVNLTDFTIDTVNQQLTGNVAVDGGADLGRVAIFDFDLSGLMAGDITNTDDPSISLLLTGAAADALADALVIPALSDLAETEFGLAATAPEFGGGDAIPLPGAAIFFVTGAAAFAARRRLGA